MIGQHQLGDLAESLNGAWASATTVPAPTTHTPGLTTLEAYAVQDMVISSRVRDGRAVAGWKLGLTSADPPATPIVGTLLDDMVIRSGAELSLQTMVGPMVEAEFVVEVGETIDHAVTLEELMRGPHHVGPGIEVIDYRTTDSRGPVDWIADNSTVAYAVVGDLKPLADVDPTAVEARLLSSSDLLATGRGDKVMGNPMAAVAWLSGHLEERGRPLRKGEFVLTGSLTGHHTVSGPGASFTADFGPLGTVTVGFIP